MSDIEKSQISIAEHQDGIWKVKIAREPFLKSKGPWSKVKSSYPLLLLLLSDMFRVSPLAFVVSMLLRMLEGFDIAITTYLSSQLLRTVEAGLVDGRIDPADLFMKMFYHVLQTVIVSCAGRYQASVTQTLQRRVQRHFKIMLLQADFRKDPTTLQKTAGLEDKLAPSPDEAWQASIQIFQFVQDVCKSVSRILLVWHISKSEGGPIFALVCAGRPLYDMLTSRSYPTDVILSYVNNNDYLRMSAISRFAESHKQDIIDNNVGKWVIGELKKAFDRLGDMPISRAPSVMYNRESLTRLLVSNAFSSILRDLPLAYCALSALRRGNGNGATTSVASIAILQQLAQSTKIAIEGTVGAFTSFLSSVQVLEAIYSTIEMSPVDSKLPYPAPDTLNDNNSKGMSLELRNVVFSYPSQQKVKPALNGLSLKISAGQIVVIVGENGCGKSTLLKILSRLYEATSGEFLIDGNLANQYISEDLQQATVILSQDSDLYPLNLAENIGLGNVENVENEEMLLDAAKQGGALKVIENLKDGLQTVLEPHIRVYASNLYNKTKHPLYEEMMNIAKDINLSGGEKQRVVAARAFFKFKTGQVRLVAVDEPSSALDAEAELELFKNLVAERNGKTMIMVTHRFGHLTKDADVVICMHDGKIVESGAHEDLMKKQGRYAKLYSIQAGAFRD